MANQPTNVTRLERDLCKAGLSDIGAVLSLHPDANDEGHEWYGEYITVCPGGVHVDFWDRYSEKAVRMNAHMSAEKLIKVAKTLAECDTKNHIGIEVIVPVRTAVAVCQTLANRR